MYGIQEMVEHTEDSRKLVERHMDSYGSYVHEKANPYMGLKRSVARELRESIHATPLREFLVKSGSSGVAGAAYLVPTKLHDILYYTSREEDLVPLISKVVDGWEGGGLKVDIVKHESLKAREYGSGGEIQADTPETVQATITPKAFGWNIALNNELVEDSQFGLIEWHTQQAGKAMGRYATELALAVLKAASDGDGSKNSATGATTDTTVWSEIVTAIKATENDLHDPNTMLVTHEAWLHDIQGTMGNETAGGSAGDFWQAEIPLLTAKPPAEGFDFKAHTMDVKFCDADAMHDSGDAAGAAFTTCVTILFDRNNAMLTGRKRWLAIENYSKPMDDLSGAVVTARQDSVTLYDDAVYVLTEST